MSQARTVDQLLTALRPDSSPALIWYGPDGERVELSGRVLDNWVAKTANLLAEELDAEPGAVVRLAMAPHWRSVVWALASWQVGATVDASGTGSAEAAAADVVVSSDLSALGSGPAYQVAVAEGALALGWPGELPEDVLDYAAEVRSYADVYLETGSADPQATALKYDGGEVTFADLLQVEPAERNILVPAAADWADVLRASVATWLGGGTVVLAHTSVQPEKLVESERITEQL
ncbi:hypothetical protein D477_018094 [Arthrobacter crystallopoietes BAB-32]|uniref:TIGR03089 family protein n=1 Tax=Arthrobacter crystallopoietes BAB-32 TaxID=1246476 RepID=N1V3N5_9MICC|nr:TIGR03089 family protein [Arthrobacter crystallopoietes]EMY32833.1 hypothetical protein D477_018094 [Arthrobacter crystallopoietes BAB-32]